MRKIPDIDGKRMCRKCAKLLPTTEFSEFPRRHVCKLCKSRMWTEKGVRPKKTTAHVLMRTATWDAQMLFRVPHNLSLLDIPAIPIATQAHCTEARIVPIDYRVAMAAYNAVVVDKVIAKCMHLAFLEADYALYKDILALRYADARKPIEVVSLV